jgi:uncharacterized repeat protein (TIGR03803 family)
MDATRNLYGVTTTGGVKGGGTAFELSPSAGRWTETILHFFGNGLDGQVPRTSLIRDVGGNLYGTTNKGGAYGGIDSYGMAFELSPQGNGIWSETDLHDFGATATDGQTPWAGLVADAAGNLYGTTNQGGVNSVGTVYKLSKTSGGKWVEQIIHNFTGLDSYPVGSLLVDSAGNLYGVTSQGSGVGTVFELKPTTKSSWKHTVLHSFSGSDGRDPYAGVIMDSAGNLYGTTTYGGSGTCQYGCGVVYELERQTGGGWKEKILHQFANDGIDGVNPFGKLVMDAAGNLYGTTFYGGRATCGGCGVVYELIQSAGGSWTEKIVHSFGATGTDGANPYAELILDPEGNLYGTTYSGGTLGWGTVFQLKP